MKSILERALVHLLNEENEKAEELMHQFVIETARNIHESLREGDEFDIEGEMEGGEEDFFSDADLEDAEVEGAEEDLGDEMDIEGAEGEDFADEELAGEEEFGAEEGAETAEEKIDEIEDELAELTAKFEEMMAKMDAEDAGDDVADEEEFGAEDFGGEEEAAEEDFGGEEAAEEFGGEEAADEGEEEEVTESAEEEEFDDITEAVIDELKKASVPNTDGRGATGGSNVTANSRTSMHGQSAKPHPAKSTGGEHHGYDREAAPKSEATKGGSTDATKADWNSRAKSTTDNKDEGGFNKSPTHKHGGAKVASKADGKKSDTSVVGRTKNPK